MKSYWKMLIQGPKNDKLERVIPEGTKVLKTYMENDCLVIDFSKDFLNYDMEKENGKNNIGKINCKYINRTYRSQ